MDQSGRDHRSEVAKTNTDPATKARFEAVAMPHLDAVYRVARALAVSDADAEDLVQETFVRAFRAFDRFELRDFGAKPWLMRILHNTFYSMMERRRREAILPGGAELEQIESPINLEWPAPADGEPVPWDRLDEQVKKAVEELQPEYRTALLLWALEGLSYKEIAEACNCALGTVMSRLYRARQLVGRKLRDYASDRQWSTERFD